MPSINMKTKQSSGCLRENNGLRVCQKSFVVSKNPSSPVWITHEAAELDAGFQNNREECLCNKVPAQDTADDKVSDSNELMMEEDLQFQKQSPSKINFASAERVESTPPNSPSNVETIFSPILEPSEVHSERDVKNNSESNDDITAVHPREDNCEDGSRSSSEYQSCNSSDFLLSDMIVAASIEVDSFYDDFKDTTGLPDFRCDDEPDLFFDLTEEYMVMPSLEDTVEAKSIQDDRTCDDSSVELDDSSLYFAIHQLKPCNQEQDIVYSESDQMESFDPHMYLRNLPDLPDAVPDCQTDPLPMEIQKKKSVTLVLDLDETLVHSTLEPCEDADFNFPVFFNMKEHTVYVRKRPYLRLFLERVAEMFEIVVFTASQSIYASQLLDKLDPDGKFISRRAYRESCIFSDGGYTKDLTVLGVDLAKVAIIDNSPQVFRLQVNNGIPIKSWFDDPSDCALISLLPFLETLADADDVRPIIAKRFGGNDEKETQEDPLILP